MVLQVDAGEAEVTALFGGALKLRQPSRGVGYRVNVDAILLAAFAAGCLEQPSPRARAHAIDLGAGVGAVGFALLHFAAASRVTLVECDAHLADLAERNAGENGWAARVSVLHADVAKVSVPADLVVCNPPYVPPGRGRAPLEHTRTARYGDVSAFVACARRAAGRRARVCFVYPAIELAFLLALLRENGLEPKRLQAVHPRVDERARVFLVESVCGKPGGLVIEPPFIEMEGTSRTAALTRLLAHPGG